MTYAILAALALLLAGIAYYKRKAAVATQDRQRLRDQLQLIDTKKELDRLDQEVARAEKEKNDAISRYRNTPWRPADGHGPDTD